MPRKLVPSRTNVVILSSAITLLLAFVIVRVVHAQVPHVRVPLVVDWSHKHMVFSQPNSWITAWRLRSEPRYWQQIIRRNNSGRERIGIANDLQSAIAGPGAFERRRRRWRQWEVGPTFQRDWGQSLGAGGSTGALINPPNWWPVYPAKFSFDTAAAPSCANDFVVFPTNLAGATGGQASVIAFNNLYAGTGGSCGANPAVYWSYNTNFDGTGAATTGTVATSPVLSFDGARVAFVETRTNANGGSILHLLQWHAGDGGAIGTAAKPTSVTNWNACVAGTACMVNIVFNGAQSDTGSSPVYDYARDAMYVGDDNGVLHKFINVFATTSAGPSEVTTGNWPITVDTGRILTSPTLDTVTGNLFMDDTIGVLSYVRETWSTAGTCLAGAVPCLGSTTIAPAAHVVPDSPIVDSSTGKVFVFFGNNGAGTSVVQSDITLSASVSASLGSGTGHHLHAGDFDNTYLSGSVTTGRLYMCGSSASSAPTIQRVGFTNTGGPFANPIGTMKAAVDAVTLTVATASAECSPVTEFFNSSAPAASQDQIFFGVQASGSGLNCGGGGCVMSVNVTNQPAVLAIANSIAEVGGPSGIIVDNASGVGQASSIYFSNQGNSTAGNKCNAIAGVGCAIKVTQSGLN